MNKKLHTLIACPSEEILCRGLAFLRVSIGIIIFVHGIPKITGGVSSWQFLGSTMAIIGITFWPLFWGFLAACAEFFGGILLILGLGTRIASCFLAFTMFIATLWLLGKGNTFAQYSSPLTLFIVFVTFIIIGGGVYSLDHYLANKK